MSDTGTLRRCNRCNIDIVDEAIECPLCHGVLDHEPGEEVTVGNESKSITYPDISAADRKLKFLIKIVIFAAIVTEVTVLIVNYYTFKGVYWSLIVGVALVYGCMTLFYLLQKRRSMQRIIQVQMYLSLIFFVVLDYLLGNKGWALAYAIPITFVAIDIGVVVLMIVGIDGWQSYIMTEIVTFVLSLLLVICHLLNILNTSFFAVFSAIITGLILLGTVMFGQRMISNEIKRRFRI